MSLTQHQQKHLAKATFAASLIFSIFWLDDAYQVAFACLLSTSLALLVQLVDFKQDSVFKLAFVVGFAICRVDSRNAMCRLCALAGWF